MSLFVDDVVVGIRLGRLGNDTAVQLELLNDPSKSLSGAFGVLLESLNGELLDG